MSRASGRAIPARRDLFGAGAALLLLGTAAAGASKARELDGELLTAFRDWQPWERERQAVAKLDDEDPTWQARFDAFSGEWHDLVEEITDLPARTPEGIAIKARVLRAVLLNHVVDEDDGEADKGQASTSETLAWSLVSDMLGRAA